MTINKKTFKRYECFAADGRMFKTYIPYVKFVGIPIVRIDRVLMGVRWNVFSVFEKEKKYENK